ncbi:hypothetical protein [Marinobacter changyiensis]|uniref:hypothetical protein n=1 Tax=Marinobacter changyiensis TaxID=2604091 RepID=UPI0015D15E8F|nr:hypothetical protein [Marinobacter changyiensis]
MENEALKSRDFFGAMTDNLKKKAKTASDSSYKMLTGIDKMFFPIETEKKDVKS